MKKVILGIVILATSLFTAALFALFVDALLIPVEIHRDYKLLTIGSSFGAFAVAVTAVLIEIYRDN